MAALEETRILLTAAEAYPAFEERVAAARRSVTACFRVFDPFTRLRSEAGRAYGGDWFDLIAGKLAEGVSVHLVVSDFDPIGRPELHRQTWASLRALWAAGEVSGAPWRLLARPGMHPARAEGAARVLFWPKARAMANAEVRRLSDLSPEERAETLRLSPGLASILEENGTKTRFWPPARLIPATHHQKLAVIDDEWLYIGGLDLDERRYDSPVHDRAPEETWHDVQILTRGDVVGAAIRHLESFEEVCARLEPPPPADPVFLRTLSGRKRRGGVGGLSPRTLVDELRGAHLDGIAAAQDLVYLETQFLRDDRIASALVRAASEKPHLHLLAVLPAAPEDVAFDQNDGADARFGEFLQARAVGRIAKAFGRRCFFAAPARPAALSEKRTGRDRLDGAPIIYVHAKLAVFDRETAIVSSANLNGRSLSWDTEAGLRLPDPDLAGELLERCLGHWHPEADALAGADGGKVVSWFRERAQDDRDRQPGERRGLLLPYRLAPARRFGRNLPGMPESMV